MALDIAALTVMRMHRAGVRPGFVMCKVPFSMFICFDRLGFLHPTSVSSVGQKFPFLLVFGGVIVVRGAAAGATRCTAG
jgi:hypothetical protein